MRLLGLEMIDGAVRQEKEAWERKSITREDEIGGGVESGVLF